LVIDGYGFETKNMKDNVIKICSYDCNVQNVTSTSVECIS